MLPLHKGCYLFPPCCLISAVWLWLFDFSVWPSPSVLLAAFCLIYDSLELMVQNQDLCPWCCDWIGAGSLASSRLSLSISLSLPLLLSLSLSLSLSLARSLAPSGWGERRSEMAGERLGRWSVSPRSISFVFPTPPLASFRQSNQTARWRKSRLTFRQGHQTSPYLSSLFIPLTPPALPPTHSNSHTHAHILPWLSVPLCRRWRPGPGCVAGRGPCMWNCVN